MKPKTDTRRLSRLLHAKERDVRFGKFFAGGLAVRMPRDKANPRQTQSFRYHLLICRGAAFRENLASRLQRWPEKTPH